MFCQVELVIMMYSHVKDEGDQKRQHQIIISRTKCQSNDHGLICKGGDVCMLRSLYVNHMGSIKVIAKRICLQFYKKKANT